MTEEEYGWTVGNLNKRFETPGVPGMVDNFADPKTTLFPGGYGTRRAYRFDFADQQVLSRTLGIERVARRLCFDSAALMCLLELLKHAGVLRTLRHRWARDAVVALLSRFHVGSDRFAVKGEAERLIDERPVLYV